MVKILEKPFFISYQKCVILNELDLATSTLFLYVIVKTKTTSFKQFVKRNIFTQMGSFKERTNE